ncbi:MAG: hypothetical protein QMD80_09290, partial [archaeon]|nr:hypothetical protein [archaeon]
MNPKEHIEDIQNDRKDLSDRNLRLVTGSISTIKKAFPSESHFLMEFIQNADDAHSTSIKIEVYQDVIKIFNNGDTFSTKDVEGICGIGQSSKSAEYMGYLGVGFKSVFLMSDCPQIYSGGYRFEFDKNHWENPENTPWQVMPVWIDKELDIQNGGWNTIFVIPKAKEIDEKTIRKLEE